jgi:hypothetical protein
MITIIGMFLTYYLYKYGDTKIEKESIPVKTIETMENELTIDAPLEKCYAPTEDNPFMNLNFTELDQDNVLSRPAACNSESTKKETDQFFVKDLYRETSDLFGKMNSQRQFYTMPSTTAPNDPNGDFKNWLYSSPNTCKENQDFCSGRNEDLRRGSKSLL